jgi:hypothetical protein
MRRFTRFAALLTVVVVVLAGVSPASGKGHEPTEVPFKGTIIGEWGRILADEPELPDECDGYDWYFFASGSGKLTHLGKAEFGLGHCTTEIPPLLSEWVEGTITLTAANGDTLVIEETGEGELEFVGEGPPIGFSYVGEWHVLEGEGTGRFLNASGSGEIAGYGDIPGPLVLDFTGIITYDASDGAK